MKYSLTWVFLGLLCVAGWGQGAVIDAVANIEMSARIADSLALQRTYAEVYKRAKPYLTKGDAVQVPLYLDSLATINERLQNATAAFYVKIFWLGHFSKQRLHDVQDSMRWEIARELHEATGQQNAYFRIYVANNFIRQQQADSAAVEYRALLNSVDPKWKDYLQISLNAYTKLARAQVEAKNYQAAIRTFMEYDDFVRATPMDDSLRQHYTFDIEYRVGMLYSELGLYDKMYEAFERAERSATTERDRINVAFEQARQPCKENLRENCIASALKFYNAENYAQENMPDLWSLLAAMYFKAGSVAEGERFYRKYTSYAGETRRKFPPINLQYLSGLKAFAESRYGDAREYLESTLSSVNEIRKPYLLMRKTCNFYLAQIAIIQERTEAGRQYFATYEDVLGELNNINTNRLIAGSVVFYESEKKELQNQQLQSKNQLAEAQIQTQNSYLTAGGVGLAAALAIAGLFFYQRRKQQALNAELAARNHKIDLLYKELGHRSMSNLVLAGNLLRAQLAEVSDAGSQQLLSENEARIQAITTVQRHLSKRTEGEADYQVLLQQIARQLTAGYGRPVQTDIALAPAQLDTQQQTYLPLIVNELLTNSIKYALDSAADPHIELHSEVIDGELHLRYRDNGPGKSGIVQGTGLGSSLLATMVETLDGQWREWNAEGYCFELQLPLKPS